LHRNGSWLFDLILKPEDNVMKGYAAAGLTVLAGVALFEVALIPAVAIGGAAVLAPKYLPRLRWRLQPKLNSPVTRRGESAVVALARPDGNAPPTAFPRFGIKRAIVKTITFRIIVTTLDFTSNYVVIGEFTTAAGLSTFNLVAGPLFYLTHEAVWNYLGPSGDASVSLQLPQSTRAATTQLAGRKSTKISRALAKTITFRTIATIMDFTTNYVVVRDIATAAGLSAFGFVVGPFVYLGHEKAWDYYIPQRTPSRTASIGAATA
jgi:uncharacterized membrane protein